MIKIRVRDQVKMYKKEVLIQQMDETRIMFVIISLRDIYV